MNREEILKENRQAVLALAAKHGAGDLRVFGSVARGESGSSSDIDLLARLEPGRSLLDLSALKQASAREVGHRSACHLQNRTTRRSVSFCQV